MGSFNENLAFGQLGEGFISKWLQGRGHAVFPAYQMENDTGKGPQLFSSDEDLVLPDLLAFSDGGTYWFEAKRKTCFSWYRKTKRWTTGIDVRHYEEYQKVAHKTGLPVWLLFYHPNSAPSSSDIKWGCPKLCPIGLFGNDILVLKKTESHRSERHGKSGMVYWARESLKLMHRIEAAA